MYIYIYIYLFIYLCIYKNSSRLILFYYIYFASCFQQVNGHCSFNSHLVSQLLYFCNKKLLSNALQPQETKQCDVTALKTLPS